MKWVKLYYIVLRLIFQLGLIGKEYILNIHVYFVKKQNIKWFLDLLNCFMLPYWILKISQNVKSTTLPNQHCLSTLNDLNHNELRYHLSMINLDRWWYTFKKTILKLYNIMTLIRSFFNNNNKHYSKVFLEEWLNRLKK